METGLQPGGLSYFAQLISPLFQPSLNAGEEGSAIFALFEDIAV